MTETKPTKQNLLLPLSKLVKVRYRHGQVRIKPETLRRIDLTLLEHILHFDLGRPFGAQVELHRCPCLNVLEVTVTIATKATAWPQPNEKFAELYHEAFCIAAGIVFVDGERDGAFWTSVYRQSNSVVIHTGFGVRTTGETILASLEHQFDRTKQELFRVLGIIAGGPKPGSSRWNDED